MFSSYCIGTEIVGFSFEYGLDCLLQSITFSVPTTENFSTRGKTGKRNVR